MACVKCKSSFNLYRSKDCREINEKHVFCYHCCMSHNVYDRLDEVIKRVRCPHCQHAIVELEHIASGQIMGIDSLIKEFDLFNICEQTTCLDYAIKRINLRVQSMNGDMWAQDGVGQRGKGYLKLKHLLALRRRLEMCPETWERCRANPNYEFEVYNWNPPVCAKCDGEYNLCQCVDKSECKHVMCLGCVLLTKSDHWGGFVQCPICCSYCAGTLESLHTKNVINMGPLKILDTAVTRTDSAAQAVELLRMYDFDDETAHAQQAEERLINDAKCYGIISNLYKYELPQYNYAEGI